MMKKLLALLLAMAMVFSLSACGGGSAGSSASPSNITTSTATSTGTATDTGTATGGVKLSDLKVGMIHIGSPSDMGYTYNHDLGTKEMMKNLGLSDDQVINKYDVGEDDSCATAINECIEAGCQIIFATSFGHGPYMLEAAKNNPDVQFCHATGEDAKSAGLSNFHNYFTAIYEARYAAGIAAGMKLSELGETKLGYVAAMECAEVISGFTAFYLGAKSVCPDATMDVVYTNSWNDPVLEAQAAQTLIDGGCKVISQHSDSTAPATTAEQNGVFQCGYNSDMISAAPNASIISARSDWGIYLTYAVQCVLDGTEIPTDWCKGMADGAVYLSPLNTAIAAPGTQEAIDKAVEAIKAGTLHVFQGPLSGKGRSWGSDAGSIDVPADKWFDESATQSAPYWCYIIDGVNILS